MLIQNKTIYIVRYANAYGDVVSKIVSEKTMNRYIKNWGWKYNGDGTGLEIVTCIFKTIFNDCVIDTKWTTTNNGDIS